MNVFGYLRVSTEEQSLGLDDQREQIGTEAARRGWEPVWVTDRGVSGSVDPDDRPQLGPTLQLLEAGDVLMVAKLDRLSRSVIHGASMLDRAQREGWRLVALDLGVDTATAGGRLVANVLMAVAQWERDTISQRTRDALAQLKKQGVRLGGPVAVPEDVRQRIARERQEGQTLQGIADGLNGDGVPTAKGGECWWPSTVHGVLRSLELDQEVAA